MARKPLILLSLLVALALPGTAQAIGGDYGFEGGTPKQRATVKAALDASAFDWSLVPARITIRIASGSGSYAERGRITLDADALDAGRFSWAVVQDEYAHQVDFFLLDAGKRALLTAELGATDWCYGVPGLAHSAYGCERFASTLVWSYWPSPDNAYRPTSKNDEAAAMAPGRFRALLGTLLGAPALDAAQLRIVHATQRTTAAAASGRKR